MLTDSHCHLASHRFARDEVGSLVGNALSAGVSRLVTLATCLDDVDSNLLIAEHPAVHACLGIHPCDVHHAPDDAVERIAERVADPRVCAIGETGLDYFHAAPDGWSDASFRERQRVFLIRHFELGADCGLNVVVHTRDREGCASFEDALEIYRRYHDRVRAVFHCFIGSWENAARVIDLGGLVSFGGVCTFRNAREALDSAIRCPAGSFMLETDAPYLAPEPHRGRRNEPAYVWHTAEFLSGKRGEALADLATHTSETAARFFRFRSAGI
jgi:TatD DNase family protein